MIGRKDMKQETMAKRIRNRAMDQKMVSPRKKMDMGMSPGPDMGAASAPPMGPMGMKKGGMAKKSFSGVPAEAAKKMAGMKKSGKAKTYEGVPAEAAKFAGMKKGGMAKKAKGGMMLVIGIGKKKGK